MKVLIDLIEHLRETITGDTAYTLNVMQLQERQTGQFTPAGESCISHYRVDDQQKKIFLFLGMEPLNATETFEQLNLLSNEAMMYELKISYSAAGQRVDQEVIGFGTSAQEKKYLLFIQTS